ncbi:MAG TPA: hypothetical protein VGO55_08375 [Allosphingosinicella sp.]|jgi:hypothetical protein|nr:hypothetical protein [Allosphingosinicella sp.]
MQDEGEHGQDLAGTEQGFRPTHYWLAGLPGPFGEYRRGRICSNGYARRQSSDEGRDGFFYGVPDEPFAMGDGRQTTIQCKHFSNSQDKLTPGKLVNEFKSITKLVTTGRAHGYVLTRNANVTEAHRKAIVAELEKCGVTQPYIHGRERIVAKILEHHKVRSLVPRVYGLGDLSWIKDDQALEQAKSIIDSMGDDLACYVPTKAHRDAVSALDKHRVVLLLGDPAVGKSR